MPVTSSDQLKLGVMAMVRNAICDNGEIRWEMNLDKKDTTAGIAFRMNSNKKNYYVL